MLTSRFTLANQRLSAINETTFHPRFHRLPSWAANLLQHLKIFDEHLPLLGQSNRMVVSEGGVKDGMGYFGLVIAVGTTVVARARGATRGNPRTMSSLRAEAYAFLAGVYLSYVAHERSYRQRQ